MSDYSLTLVLHFKTSEIINDMAKINIKSEKSTPYFYLITTFLSFLMNMPLLGLPSSMRPCRYISAITFPWGMNLFSS